MSKTTFSPLAYSRLPILDLFPVFQHNDLTIQSFLCFQGDIGAQGARGGEGPAGARGEAGNPGPAGPAGAAVSTVFLWKTFLF